MKILFRSPYIYIDMEFDPTDENDCEIMTEAYIKLLRDHKREQEAKGE